MKKNLFMSMLAIAGMLFATSCSQDELLNEPTTGDYVSAKFTISTPEGIGTRAAVNVGEGTTVNYVACAVYDATGEEMPDLRQYRPITNKTAEYSIRLVKGQAYRVAFFAYYGEDNGISDYYNMQYLTDIKIKDAKSNIEHRDAFTNYVDVTAQESMKAVEKPVTLYRPFAQLNLGAVAEDIEAAKKAGVVVTNSKITVSNVYTEFDAYNNAIVAGAQSKEVTFTMNEIPGQDLYVDMDNDATTADESFEYLALNYLLVGNAGSEKELTDVTFEWKTADNKTNSPATVFKNIPVQRNYRTNIIGYLLTNPAVFNITIDEKFEKPDYIVASPWDGKEVSEPESTATEYLISSPAEWAWLKGKNLNGKNIKLTANIDFGGNEVKGLGFTGTFDGDGHIMSNMTLLCGGNYYSNGLFQGDASGEVTVKNVTIENAVAECSDEGQGYVGTIFGDVQNNVTLENVHVNGADLCGVQSVGGLVGFVASGKTLTLNNCSVSGSYIHNYAVDNESGFVAGLVGRPVGTVTTSNCEVNNTIVEGFYAARRGETSIAAAVGNQTPAGVTVASDVTVKKVSMDDVVLISSAEQLNQLTVSNKYVILTADIDFQGVAMTKPIEIRGNSTFDGQGHKISNVETAVQANYATSLFRGDANSGNKVVKNLIIEKLTTPSGKDFASAIWSDLQDGANIEIDNVQINDATIQANGTIGGFVGFVGGSTTYVIIKNSSISNSTLNGGEEDKKRGAVVGRAYGCSVTCEDVIVNNVKINDVAVTTSTLVGDKGYTGIVTIK